MPNKKLFIIHFNPIELYPPVVNTLHYLEKQLPGYTIHLFTTRQNFGLNNYASADQRLFIQRFWGINRRQNAGLRLAKYLFFYGACLYDLVVKRPDTVLYYETLSSFPALLYKYFFNRRARILVHYHEYTNPTEYQHGMILVKFFHRFEVKMYASFTWISHTNLFRLEKFMNDYESVSFGKHAVLPNFPPKSWAEKPIFFTNTEILRIVYVGSLGLETMYFREFCAWVEAQSGKVAFSIYAYNVSEEVKRHLNQLQARFVCLYPGVNYEQLPVILSAYHVGVVLYKGISDNHVYSAPNKVFEYLARGLDVWFPQELLGTEEYITEGVYPKVISLNFNCLEAFQWQCLYSREGLLKKPFAYYCENVLSSLVEAIETG